MIVFSGKLSDEIQEMRIKEHLRFASQLFSVFYLSTLIVYALLAFLLLREDGGHIKKLFIYFGIYILFILLRPWNRINNLKNRFEWKFKISIDTETITVEKPTSSEKLQKPIQNIKKILDKGNCYFIICSKVKDYIICQKDLITEGSIEEFEHLFEGKIKRVKKK